MALFCTDTWVPNSDQPNKNALYNTYCLLKVSQLFKCRILSFGMCVLFFFFCRIGKQFELTLLLQSVVMILTMFAMLHLCCAVRNTNRVSTKQHRLSGKVPLDVILALNHDQIMT